MLRPEGVLLDEGPACPPDVIYRVRVKNKKLPSILYQHSSKKCQTTFIQLLGEGADVAFFTGKHKLSQLLFMESNTSKGREEKRAFCGPSWFSGNSITWP